MILKISCILSWYEMVAILKGVKRGVKYPEKIEPLFFCIFGYMKMHNQQKNQFWQKNLAESVFFTSVHSLLMIIIPTVSLTHERNASVLMKLKE